ncbi:MAG: AAA family ATPase [Acidobacteria bacterium]|nr:AAA family ATPase [Acidobacteriota bacterium]
MIPEIERRIAEFVDRESQMERFKETLGLGDKRVFFVSGGEGMGKSSLLARMVHECALRGIRRSELVWTETRNHNYLAILRKIRDDLDPACFQGFTEMANSLFHDPRVKVEVAVTAGGTISVAQGAQIGGSQVGDIAGVVLRDCMFVVPRPDLDMPEPERMTRLTDQFFGEFVSFLRNTPVVLFFDAVEKMTEETRKWVWSELIGAIRQGTLPNLVLVQCGRVQPQLDWGLRSLVEIAELPPLQLPDIVEYLQKRGIEPGRCDDLARMLLAASDGSPMKVAAFTDTFLTMGKKGPA